MKNKTLYFYTRQFCNATGASVHMALGDKGKTPKPLNHHFGIVYAKGELTEGPDEGTTKGLIQPWGFRTAHGGIGIAALRRDLEKPGEVRPEKGREHEILIFQSANLIDYTEEMVEIAPPGKTIEDLRCFFDGNIYTLQVLFDNEWHHYESDNLKDFKESSATMDLLKRTKIDIWDSQPASALEVSAQEAEILIQRFTAPDVPGGTEIFPFPLMPPRADPQVFTWKGKYLFIATDDENNQLALKLRLASSLSSVPKEKDHVILKANKEGDMSGCMWAPELHWIGGKLAILFAAGKPHWYTVQCRVMILQGEDPLDASCWSSPRLVTRKDGSPLAPEGSITLDMTQVISGERAYVVWSQRPLQVTPHIKCGTADLYIAPIDPREPWKLADQPVRLSRPEFGWERIHSAVNEGPFAMYRQGRIFLTYASALIDATYCQGLLEARDGDDLCDLKNWSKTGYPVMHRLSRPEQVGSGHCSYMQEDDRYIMAYHALDIRNYTHDSEDTRRYPGFRQVIWDKFGFPHFDGE